MKECQVKIQSWVQKADSSMKNLYSLQMEQWVKFVLGYQFPS